MDNNEWFFLDKLEEDVKDSKDLADRWKDKTVEDVEMEICLGLEFYCASHGQDIKAVVEHIRNTVVSINEVMGPLEYDEGDEESWF